MMYLLEEYVRLFDIFCIDYLEELPTNIRRKQGIINVSIFCKKLRPQFKELITYFFNDEKKFERLVISLGRKLYKNDLSIAFIVDVINTTLFKIINYINTEHLPNHLIEHANQFMRKFTNLIALGFILESLPEKERKLEAKLSSSIAKSLLVHFSRLKNVLKNEDYQIKKLPDCPIMHYIRSLEFKIVCHKLEICKEASRLHSLIHTYLKLFRTYFNERKYLPAYLILITVYFLFEKLGEIFNNVESAKKKHIS